MIASNFFTQVPLFFNQKRDNILHFILRKINEKTNEPINKYCTHLEHEAQDNTNGPTRGKENSMEQHDFFVPLIGLQKGQNLVD